MWKLKDKCKEWKTGKGGLPQRQVAMGEIPIGMYFRVRVCPNHTRTVS